MSQINMISANGEGAAIRHRRALKRLVVVAVLAIALGFFMQGFVLAAKLATGAPFPGSLLLVDLAQGVTWSFLVCAGVGIGTFLSKARPAMAGLIAMLFAPIALGLAKSSQKVMAGLLNAADQPAVLSLATISVLRAIEYGILGWLLAMLVQKEVVRPLPFLGSGAGIGIVFGGAISALTFQTMLANGIDPAAPKIAATIVNEVAFPIGCSLVIFVGQMVGRNLKVLLGSEPNPPQGVALNQP